jgi:hypothetical protein
MKCSAVAVVVFGTAVFAAAPSERVLTLGSWRLLVPNGAAGSPPAESSTRGQSGTMTPNRLLVFGGFYNHDPHCGYLSIVHRYCGSLMGCA